MMKELKLKSILLYSIIILTVSVSDAQINLQSGLVAYYPFNNGNSNDESGNSHHGLIFGPIATTDRFNISDKAFSFNGTSDLIQVNDFDIPRKAITVSLWVKPDATFRQNTNRDFMSKHNSGVDCELIVKLEFDGKYDFESNIGGIFHDMSAKIGYSDSIGVVAPTGNWDFLLATYDGAVIKFYVNNSLVATQPASGSIYNNSFPLKIGGYSTSHENVKGKIDEIRIYNRVLSPQETTALYQEGVCYQSVTVTDVLIINANITSYNPIAYQNSIKLYPNPTNDQLNIDFGSNFSTINGYNLKITNTLGQTVFTTLVTQQYMSVNLSTWSGMGNYFVHLIDNRGNIIDIRKIVLQ